MGPGNLAPSLSQNRARDSRLTRLLSSPKVLAFHRSVVAKGRRPSSRKAGAREAVASATPSSRSCRNYPGVRGGFLCTGGRKPPRCAPDPRKPGGVDWGFGAFGDRRGHLRHPRLGPRTEASPLELRPSAARSGGRHLRSDRSLLVRPLPGSGAHMAPRIRRLPLLGYRSGGALRGSSHDIATLSRRPLFSPHHPGDL